MSQPTVCAVMLTRDRPEMARQAVECFRSQTYEQAKRMLLILDAGSGSWYDAASDAENEHQLDATAYRDLTIGALRNMANECAGCDIVIHVDDDDWSHPNRIAEQVSLLQSTGADCVGYREMLFWRDVQRIREAWLYSNPLPSYALGTSLCYWRKTWEQRPFEATSLGEDARFIAGLKCVGVPAVPADNLVRFVDASNAPRMVARIHGGNTSTGYSAQNFRMQEWKRVPEWDAHCRSVFA